MTVMEKSSNIALEQYLTRVGGLFDDIARWSVGFGLQVAKDEITINEERHGQYQAPKMILSNAEGKHIADVVSFGESILGAWGRVDIVGEYGKREKVAYLSEGGPTISTRIQDGAAESVQESVRRLYRGVDAEGWYWVSPSPIRRAYPITQEVFADLLSAVTGHELKT